MLIEFLNVNHLYDIIEESPWPYCVNVVLIWFWFYKSYKSVQQWNLKKYQAKICKEILKIVTVF